MIFFGPCSRYFLKNPTHISDQIVNIAVNSFGLVVLHLQHILDKVQIKSFNMIAKNSATSSLFAAMKITEIFLVTNNLKSRQW